MASDGTYATYQCKRYDAVAPSDIKNAVTKFLDGDWAKKSGRFVFCTPANLDATQLANEVETQARRLKRRRPPIAFEVWDAEELSVKLRAHPDLVVEFFDWPWYHRFFQPKVESQPSEQQVERQVSLASLDLHRSYRGVRLVHLDWASDRLQQRLKQFEEEHPSEFELISEHIGIPPNPRLLTATIEERPPWLMEAGSATWAMLGRIAEGQGEWAAAATAWERKAQSENGSSRADSLVSAAIASGIGEDQARRNDLMAQARHADPEHPRVRLEDLDQDLPVEALYDALAAIRSEDRIVQAIIECQMALASLRKPDVAQAKTHLREAERLDGTSLNTRAVGVNVAVQSGRRDVLAGIPLNATELRDAHREALSVRDELLKQRRWSESVRLLMLAAGSPRC